MIWKLFIIEKIRKAKDFKRWDLVDTCIASSKVCKRKSENETPRWTTDTGLAKIICLLRLLHVAKDRSGRPYPIYHNELMENVHNYDRRTIRLGEKLDGELLKRSKVKAEVIRNGMMVYVVLEKEIVDLIEEPNV
ncbi:unnamed protein product, partial [Mesorhabditis belari]|uniref:Uncharacterized protein n=1 Tax=Mesorhabditis belari TaxID=2138241 RepID=A0AAF3FSX4_9BILA